jgi:CheY-like chemotaxis protein
VPYVARLVVSANTCQYGGSGLGLFISRELTEMQGGSIGVQSTQGVGSTFSFYIRSRRAAAPEADAANLSLLQKSGQQPIHASDHSIPGGPSLLAQNSQYHILVVEDNLINQRVLCNQLKKMGCTVQVANHGGEALNELAKTTYYKEPTIASPFKLSVVLLDVEMPVMDGLTCARKIRELQETGNIVGHVPIIAVSANARREQVEQARQAGMDDAISKPFRIPELMATIDGLLSR